MVNIKVARDVANGCSVKTDIRELTPEQFLNEFSLAYHLLVESFAELHKIDYRAGRDLLKQFTDASEEPFIQMIEADKKAAEEKKKAPRHRAKKQEIKPAE